MNWEAIGAVGEILARKFHEKEERNRINPYNTSAKLK